MVTEAQSLDLVATAIDTFGDGDRIVRFGQLHQGIPVVGSGAAVRLNARGETVLTSSALAHVLPASISPTVPAGAAAATARTRTWLPVRDADAKLVVLSARGEAKLAWVFLPTVPMGLAVAPRILVDAHSGEILEARDLALHAQITAKMYASNPAKSPTLEDLPFAISPTGAGGTLSNDVITSLNCAGEGVPMPVSFQGAEFQVRACQLAQTATPTSGGKYDYVPMDDASNAKAAGSDSFSEVSMYYHASRIYNFFRTLQGDPAAQVVAEKPLRTISNLRLDSKLFEALATGNIGLLPGPTLVPQSNAFYSPAGGGFGPLFEQLYGFKEGAMWFFQGPAKDYAYDGDVVYHEFTHAMINNTIQLGAWHLDKYGLVDAPGAINEGLADYFSSALTGDPDVGEYASKDIDAKLKVIRTLDNTDKCPTGVLGEVHYDSTLFSGALWTARVSLGSDAERTSFDKALYKAIRTNAGKGDLGYEDMANLFLATLTTDFAGGATALTKAFSDRGLLPACTRQYVYDGTPLTAPKASGLPGYAAPGTQSLPSGGKMAPGILQVKIALPADTAKMTVTFDVPKTSGGGGSPFGGGTPFTPSVLVKWGEQITWNVTGTPKSDAEVTLVPMLAGQTYTAIIDVPAGSKAAAVQVANTGASDGYYGNLAIATTAGAPVPADAPDGGAGGSTTAGATPAATPSEVSAGCGCKVTASSKSTETAGFLVAALGGLALVSPPRRRD